MVFMVLSDAVVVYDGIHQYYQAFTRHWCKIGLV